MFKQARVRKIIVSVSLLAAFAALPVLIGLAQGELQLGSQTMSETMNLVRASVAGLDASLPVIDVRSADDIVAASARPQQLTGSVISAFAVSALVLAAIGLYGLISYSVAQRRQELGVRAAIVARPRDLKSCLTPRCNSSQLDNVLVC